MEERHSHIRQCPTFFQPVWLLLLVPLAAAWFAWPLPNRGLRILRAVVFVLVDSGAGAVRHQTSPTASGTVIVVADRSESMPKMPTLRKRKSSACCTRPWGRATSLGVVAFGRQAVVEQSPQRGEFGGFTAQVGADHSEPERRARICAGPDSAGRRRAHSRFVRRQMDGQRSRRRRRARRRTRHPGGLPPARRARRPATWPSNPSSRRNRSCPAKRTS